MDRDIFKYDNNSNLVVSYYIFTPILCLCVCTHAEVDACVEPVLEMDEAGNHPHNK